MMEFDIFEVGGAVRDDLLGIKTKDIDFVMVPRETITNVTRGLAAMRLRLRRDGFKIHTTTVDKFVVRCGVPARHPLAARTKDADFVLARRDGPYSDGRRPDFVVPGTLEDDLARRDFTINAIARNPLTGELIDPHGGVDDLERRTLRFVGDPIDRIQEDGIRVMRAFRFQLTKGLWPAGETLKACRSEFAAEMLERQAREMVRDELVRCFREDTLGALRLFAGLPDFTREAIFCKGLRLDATLAQ